MSTKLVVVKLRDILKTSIFAILGIIILSIVVYLFMPKNNNEVSYNKGVYSSEIILHSKPVSVEVTVSKDKILDVSLVNLGETQEVFYPLFETEFKNVKAHVLDTQSTENIQMSVDKSMTTGILIDAVDKALLKAKS